MEKRQPLISVIIATYNRSNILKYTIGSVLKQDYRNFEIIVIGDHCTDDTEVVVNSFHDPRIRFYNLEKNHGDQSLPNNTGFQKSRGELIAWLNHDDIWFPDHLSTLEEAIHINQADICYSWRYPYNFQKYDMEACVPPVFFENNSYQPFYGVPASLWLVRKTAVEETGLWRHASDLYIAPSKDWLKRAYKKKKKIIPVPKLTVITVQSGARKNSYAERQFAENEYVYSQISRPFFREQLLTDMCYYTSLLYNRVTFKDYVRYIFMKPLQAFFTRFNLSYASLKNAIKYRKKGGYIENLRRLRGIEPVTLKSGLIL